MLIGPRRARRCPDQRPTIAAAYINKRSASSGRWLRSNGRRQDSFGARSKSRHQHPVCTVTQFPESGSDDARSSVRGVLQRFIAQLYTCWRVLYLLRGVNVRRASFCRVHSFLNGLREAASVTIASNKRKPHMTVKLLPSKRLCRENQVLGILYFWLMQQLHENPSTLKVIDKHQDN